MMTMMIVVNGHRYVCHLLEENIYKTTKATRPKGVKNDRQASKSLRSRVTLTFDLLTPKGDRFITFMPLSRGPLSPIGIKISSFVFKLSSSQVW